MATRGARALGCLLVAVRSARASAAAGGSEPFVPAVRAVLFDFDGSLVQSEETHRLCFSKVLNRDLDKDLWYKQCVGRRPLSILQEFRLPGSPPAEELYAYVKQDATRRYDQVEGTEGYGTFLRDLQRAGVRSAVVSSGSRMYIERVLAHLGLQNRFEFVVAGDDPEVEGRHKPDPYPYTFAARRMALSASDCVVVEDSPAGIQSAISAGMRVVAVRNPANKDLPILHDPAVVAVVDDFAGLDRGILGCATSERAREPASVV